jgi:hypothetical protein
MAHRIDKNEVKNVLNDIFKFMFKAIQTTTLTAGQWCRVGLYFIRVDMVNSILKTLFVYILFRVHTVAKYDKNKTKLRPKSGYTICCTL